MRKEGTTTTRIGQEGPANQALHSVATYSEDGAIVMTWHPDSLWQAHFFTYTSQGLQWVKTFALGEGASTDGDGEIEMALGFFGSPDHSGSSYAVVFEDQLRRYDTRDGAEIKRDALADIFGLGMKAGDPRAYGFTHWLNPFGEPQSPPRGVDITGSTYLGLGDKGFNSYPVHPETGDDPCVETFIGLCVQEDNFRVRTTFVLPDGTTRDANGVRTPSDQSGLFWFFDEDNWEVMIKILDGCAINDHYWVFSAATTTVEYTLRVTDTLTREVREYQNPAGKRSDAITDTSAFAACL